MPLEPINREFNMTRHPIIELKWKANDAESVYLQVSRSKRFYPDQLDIDTMTPRLNGARLQALAPGTYFWRVASGSPERRVSEWSAAERFEIVAPGRRHSLEDQIPPPLENVQIQQHGNVSRHGRNGLLQRLPTGRAELLVKGDVGLVAAGQIGCLLKEATAPIQQRLSRVAGGEVGWKGHRIGIEAHAEQRLVGRSGLRQLLLERKRHDRAISC